MEYKEILESARTCIGPYCKACSVYCAHLSSAAALRQRAKRAIMGADHNYPIFVGADARIGSQHRRQNPDDI